MLSFCTELIFIEFFLMLPAIENKRVNQSQVEISLFFITLNDIFPAILNETF